MPKHKSMFLFPRCFQTHRWRKSRYVYLLSSSIVLLSAAPVPLPLIVRMTVDVLQALVPPDWSTRWQCWLGYQVPLLLQDPGCLGAEKHAGVALRDGLTPECRHESVQADAPGLDTAILWSTVRSSYHHVRSLGTHIYVCTTYIPYNSVTLQMARCHQSCRSPPKVVRRWGARQLKVRQKHVKIFRTTNSSWIYFKKRCAARSITILQSKHQLLPSSMARRGYVNLWRR